jgi:hypothetical protein
MKFFTTCTENKVVAGQNEIGNEFCTCGKVTVIFSDKSLKVINIKLYFYFPEGLEIQLDRELEMNRSYRSCKESLYT